MTGRSTGCWLSIQKEPSLGMGSSPVSWAVGVRLAGQRQNCSQASSLIPRVRNVQEPLRGDDHSSHVDRGNVAGFCKDLLQPPPASQEIQEEQGGLVGLCRSSTRPSSNQAEHTNPSASFCVPPPDVPAPRPTPCTPPRHTLHPLSSPGTASQTPPCGAGLLWLLELTSSPCQHPAPSLIPSTDPAQPQLGQDLHPGTVAVTKADRHPENAARSQRGRNNRNPPSCLLLTELSRARHRR